jgi:hypothetical protein
MSREYTSLMEIPIHGEKSHQSYLYRMRYAHGRKTEHCFTSAEKTFRPLAQDDYGKFADPYQESFQKTQGLLQPVRWNVLAAG